MELDAFLFEYFHWFILSYDINEIEEKHHKNILSCVVHYPHFQDMHHVRPMREVYLNYITHNAEV